MTELFDGLISLGVGDVGMDAQSLDTFSHDASLFEIKPKVVVFPKDSLSVCKLVQYAEQHQKESPDLSLTARSGGTDMSGGAINDSIIVSFQKYFTHIGKVEGSTITVQPGVYYHDLEPITLRAGLLLPSYPASRELCMIGGMVANNSGGEKSLHYGKTQNFVKKLKIVLSDGHEYEIGPLNQDALKQKTAQNDFEGQLYRRVYDLITKNKNLIAANKPHVTKNSTGYNVWDVWDGKTFDLTKIIVGSQGTLGLVTETTFQLVPAKPLSGMVVAFLPSLDHLGKIINEVLPLQPTSFESFDEHTLKFAFRFFLSFRKTLGWKRFVLLGLSFIPLLNKLLRYLPHLPKLILLIEFEAEQQGEIDQKLSEVIEKLKQFNIETQIAKNKKHEEKFWTIRRESFNLLRKNVKKLHTAPFIDDLIVPTDCLEEFLPKLTGILEEHKLLYTVAGHMGDGNFHIIPLMNLSDPNERAKIPIVLDEVTKLILQYHGSLSGEHNDGIIRGPYLEPMYGKEMLQLFRDIKSAFDPSNIFNRHKKTDATLEFAESHIRQKFGP